MAQEKAVEQAAAANPGAHGAERWGQAPGASSSLEGQKAGAEPSSVSAEHTG